MGKSKEQFIEMREAEVAEPFRFATKRNLRFHVGICFGKSKDFRYVTHLDDAICQKQAYILVGKVFAEMRLNLNLTDHCPLAKIPNHKTQVFFGLFNEELVILNTPQSSRTLYGVSPREAHSFFHENYRKHI